MHVWWLSEPGAKPRVLGTDWERSAPGFQTPDAARAHVAEEDQNQRIHDMLVDEEGVRIRVREIQDHKIIQGHEQNAEPGTKPHEYAEDEGKTKERESPFVQEIDDG